MKFMNGVKVALAVCVAFGAVNLKSVYGVDKAQINACNSVYGLKMMANQLLGSAPSAEDRKVLTNVEGDLRIILEKDEAGLLAEVKKQTKTKLATIITDWYGDAADGVTGAACALAARNKDRAWVLGDLNTAIDAAAPAPAMPLGKINFAQASRIYNDYQTLVVDALGAKIKSYGAAHDTVIFEATTNGNAFGAGADRPGSAERNAVRDFIKLKVTE